MNRRGNASLPNPGFGWPESEPTWSDLFWKVIEKADDYTVGRCSLCGDSGLVRITGPWHGHGYANLCKFCRRFLDGCDGRAPFRLAYHPRKGVTLLDSWFLFCAAALVITARLLL